MQHWIRFEHDGKTRFGTLAGDSIAVHEGDMFANPRPTGQTVALAAVKVLTPTQPTKMVALWNNYKMLAEKIGQTKPEDLLYLLKSSNSFLAHGEVIRKPNAYDGKVVFEGEIGIVIGKETKEVSVADAAAHIFGYTVVNDVTAAEIINKNPSFAQWVRAKSFDTFGVFGPVVTTGIDPQTLTVKTVLNGDVRQDYPVADAFYSTVEIVSKLSHDMTLYPGDVIAIGTNVGVGSMKPGSDISVTIEGIGTLANRYE